MALKKTLIERLFNMSKISTRSLINCRVSSTSVQRAKKLAPDPGDKGLFRRFLHKRAVFLNPAMSPELRSLPVGDKLMDKLRGMDIVKDRIRLDGLRPPAADRSDPTEGMAVDDVRKLLKLAQLEMVKSKLWQIEKNWISYAEFVRICGETCSDSDQGVRFAKMLDESGSVVVLGNVVLLRPEQEDLKRVKGSTFEMVTN